MPQREQIVGLLHASLVTAGVAVCVRCMHQENDILDSTDSYQFHRITSFLAFLSIQVPFIAYKMHIAY